MKSTRIVKIRVNFFLPIYPLFQFHLSQKLSFEFIFIVVAVRSDVTSVMFSFGFFASSVEMNLSNYVSIALIFFIMKFYLPFRVNFLYSKVFSIKIALI